MTRAEPAGRKHCRCRLPLPAGCGLHIYALRGWLLLCVSAFALGACGQRAARSPVAPAFADYYAAHGGMRTLGTALSESLVVDGTETQYFLGGCLQHFPGLEVGSTVIPCVLPAELRLEQPRLAADAMPDSALGFAETGHTVQFAFREFFTTHGGASFFGYPLTEALVRNETQLVQYFERSILVWDSRLPAPEAVQCLPVGSFTFDRSQAPLQAFQPVPDAVIADAASAADNVDALVTFVEAHGGAAVFGTRLSGRRTAADGAQEIVYENGILVEASNGGATLRALGRAALGQPVPPAQQLALPGVQFFPETKHNVRDAFLEFFARHGGSALFGLPLSEMHIEGGMLVQYFENAVFTFRPGAVNAQGVALRDLGRSALNAAPASTPTAEPVAGLTLHTWARFPIARADDEQEIFVIVLNRDQRPVEQALVTLQFATAEGPAVFVLPATGADGRTGLLLPVAALKATERGAVAYTVLARAGQTEAEVRSSFNVQ